jgi:ABC-2 type transport system permease protein
MTTVLPASASRVRPLRLTAAHLRRDWAIAWSYRVPFFTGLFTSIGSLVMFFFIAKLVDQSSFEDTPELANGYFAFVVLGSALTGIMAVGLSSFASQLQSSQTNGTLEAIAAAPTPLWLSVLAGSLYDLLYATASSVVTVAAAVLLFDVRFDVRPAGIPLVAAGAVATFVLFASLGMLVAAYTLVFKRVGAILTIMTASLAFMAGVFFPIDLLPRPVAVVAEVLPFTWAVDLIRLTLLAGELPVGRLAVLAASALLVAPITIYVFERATLWTRRRGTLGQY